MLIYPAIDILGGKCVRLTEGVYGSAKVYNEDPVAQALAFQDQGAKWIHIVDLDGAKEGSPVNREMIESICDALSIDVQVGGGVHAVRIARRFFERGVSRVVVGSAMTLGRQTAAAFFDAFGDKVAAAIDTRGGKVAIKGWTETSDLDGREFAKSLEELGCKYVVHTDIASDGKLMGPDVEGIGKMVSALGIPVIASGGVSSLDDLRALKSAGAAGAIIGKALYEGCFTVAEAIAATEP